MTNEFIKAFLPSGILDHFKITAFKEVVHPENGEVDLELYLEEKNQLPIGYLIKDYESKGFYKPKRIQDFPIRGNTLYLIVKRRRWRHKKTRKEIKSDYSFIAQGVKLTQEVSDFLKGTGRDPSRYA